MNIFGKSQPPAKPTTKTEPVTFIDKVKVQLEEDLQYLQTATIVNIVQPIVDLLKVVDSKQEGVHMALSELRFFICTKQEDTMVIEHRLEGITNQKMKDEIKKMMVKYQEVAESETNLDKLSKCIDYLLLLAYELLAEVLTNKKVEVKTVYQTFTELGKIKNDPEKNDITIENVSGTESVELAKKYTIYERLDLLAVVVNVMIKSFEINNQLRQQNSMGRGQMYGNMMSGIYGMGGRMPDMEDEDENEIPYLICEYLCELINGKDTPINHPLFQQIRNAFAGEFNSLKNGFKQAFEKMDADKREQEKNEMKYAIEGLRDLSKEEYQQILQRIEEYYFEKRRDGLMREIEDKRREAEEIQNLIDEKESEISRRKTDLERKKYDLDDLKNKTSPDGYYDQRRDDIENRRKQLKQKVAAEDQRDLQYINIPFESWYLEREHKIVIKVGQNQYVSTKIQITQEMRNGMILEINEYIHLVLNFTHRYYRREGNDIIYYLRENEINKDYRDSVRHPNGSSFSYSNNDFKNNEIGVDGYGFGKVGKKGRFIIRRIGSGEEIPTREHEFVDHRKENREMFLKLKNEDETNENLRQRDLRRIQELIEEIRELETITIPQLQKELEKLIETLKKIQEIIELLEKRLLNENDEDYEQNVETIIEKAKQENRIIIKQAKERNEVSYNGMDPQYGYSFTIGKKTYNVSTGGNPKDGLRKTNGEVTPAQINAYTKLLEERNYKSDLGDKKAVLKAISQGKRVIVFNMERVSSFTGEYYPVCPCYRRAFNMTEGKNDFLVFPILANAEDKQFIFEDGYHMDKKNDGIIIVNYFDSTADHENVIDTPNQVFHNNQMEMMNAMDSHKPKDFDMPPNRFAHSLRDNAYDPMAAIRANIGGYPESRPQRRPSPNMMQPPYGDHEPRVIEYDKSTSISTRTYNLFTVDDSVGIAVIADKSSVLQNLPPSIPNGTKKYKVQPVKVVSDRVNVESVLRRNPKNLKTISVTVPYGAQPQKLGIVAGQRKDFGLSKDGDLPVILPVMLSQAQMKGNQQIPETLYELEGNTFIVVKIKVK